MCYNDAIHEAKSYIDRIWKARVYDDLHGTNREEAIHAEYHNLPEEVKNALDDIAN